MEDDVDIYSDLINLNEICNKEHEDNPQLVQECTELKKQVANLTAQLENLQKINSNLEVNFLSLLKTAKTEIARKDKTIDDLRKRLDNIAFRRRDCNSNTSHSRHIIQREMSTSEPPILEDDFCKIENDRQLSGKSTSEVKEEDMHEVCGMYGVMSTLYGERLYRRIIEKKDQERKQKQFNETATVSTVESEKGCMLQSAQKNSLSVNNDDKENQSCSSVTDFNTESISMHNKIVNDVNSDTLVEKNNIITVTQERTVLSMRFCSKRSNEDASDTCATKRMKFEKTEGGTVKSEGCHKDMKLEENDSTNAALWNVMQNIDESRDRKPISENQSTTSCQSSGTPESKNERNRLVNTFNGSYDGKRANERALLSRRDTLNSPECRQDLNEISRYRRNHGYSDISDRRYRNGDSNGFYDRNKCHRFHKFAVTATDSRSAERRHQKRGDDRYRDHKDEYERHRDTGVHSRNCRNDFKKGSYDLRGKLRYRSRERNDAAGSYCSNDRRTRYSCREKSHYRFSLTPERNRSSSSEKACRAHNGVNIGSERARLWDGIDNNVFKGDSGMEQRVDADTDVHVTPEVASANDVKAIVTDKMVARCAPLEDGEIIDSPNESPAKNQIAVLRNVGEFQISSACSSEYSRHSSACLREERIENVDKFVINSREKREHKLDEEKCTSDVASNTIRFYDCVSDREVPHTFKRQTSRRKFLEGIDGGTIAKHSLVDTRHIENTTSMAKKDHDEVVVRATAGVRNTINDDNRMNVKRAEKLLNIKRLDERKIGEKESGDTNGASRFIEGTQEPAIQTVSVSISKEEDAKEINVEHKLSTSKKDNLPLPLPVPVSSLLPPPLPAPSLDSAKVIVLARRRKRVQLVDNNASMTIIVNSRPAKSPVVVVTGTTTAASPCRDTHAEVIASLKPRACKMQRSYKEIVK